MEYKIGETFEVDGKTYITVKANDRFCDGCAFHPKCGGIDFNTFVGGHCSCDTRSDKTNVIFKEISDINKPNKQDNMKPFNLEQAKAGKPVCTREGREARIICFDARCETPIIALITADDGEEIAFDYFLDGTAFGGAESPCNDLMMRGEKKKGYVALFKAIENDFLAYCSNIYETPEKVREGIGYAGCMGIVEVEWEE